MSLKSYISLCFLVLAIELTIVFCWQVFTLDFDITPAGLLFVRTLIDIIFIALNFNRIFFKKFEICFLIWIAVGALIGAYGLSLSESDYKFDRLLKDQYHHFIFFKVAIARSFFADNSDRVKFIVAFSIIISIYHLLLFYVINASQYIYVGLTPPTNAIISGGIAYSSSTLFLMAFVFILLAGKRAYLISMAHILHVCY